MSITDTDIVDWLVSITDTDIVDWLVRNGAIYISAIEFDHNARLSVDDTGNVREVLTRQIAHEQAKALAAMPKLTLLDRWNVVDGNRLIVSRGWGTIGAAEKDVAELQSRYPERAPYRVVREAYVE